MRVYALLLGVALTTSYAIPAQLAVSSLHPKSPVAAGRVWYGGVLDPITVESQSGPSATAANAHVVTRPTVRCAGSQRPAARTIS